MNGWSPLPLLRAMGVLPPSELGEEVKRLEAQRDALSQHAAASDAQLAELRVKVKKGREQREAAIAKLGEMYTPYLDIMNERVQQAQGVDAMSGVVEKHVQRVDTFNTDRGEMYGYKARYLHSLGVVLSQLGDKVNLGLPFAVDLHAMQSVTPAPVPDSTHEAVLASMRNVARSGAPTLYSLTASFGSLQAALFGREAVVARVREALGDEGAVQLKKRLSDIRQKLEGSAVGAAIQGVEDVSDEFAVIGPGAEKTLRQWHQRATDYSVAQQGLHFLSCELTLQRYAMLEAYQRNKMLNSGVTANPQQ